MPEPGSTADAAGVSVFRWKNRRVSFMAENVFFQASGNILVDSWNLRSSSAHHDHIGIKEIDHLSQTAREPVFESLQGSKRRLFACAASRDDFRAFQRDIRRALIIRFQARSGNPGFHAAVPPAVTSRAR